MDRLLVVRLTLALLRQGELALARAASPRRADLAAARSALACSRPELRFARALLERRTNLWLLRVDQRAFAGDFVVIDVSPPRVERRSACVLELKRGAPLRRVGVGHHQLRRAAIAVAVAAEVTGVLLPDAPHEAWLGDPDVALGVLAARRPGAWVQSRPEHGSAATPR